jgi:hypothetical protein
MSSINEILTGYDGLQDLPTNHSAKFLPRCGPACARVPRP